MSKPYKPSVIANNYAFILDYIDFIFMSNNPHEIAKSQNQIIPGGNSND